MQTPYYYLKVDVEGPCGAIIGLNQAPLFVKHSPEGGATNMPVNEFMLREKNKLTGYVFWPPEVPYEEGKVTVRATVYQADPSKQAPEPGHALATYEFPLEEKPEAYPHAFEVDLDLKSQEFLLDLVEAKKTNSLDRDDLSDIAVEVNSYIEALLDYDLAAAWKITRRRWEAIEQTNRYDEGAGKKLLGRQIETLEKRSQGRKWQVDFAMDEVVARPCYDHQLFWVCGCKNQRGAFTLYLPDPTEPEKIDRSFSMPLYLGKTIDGWKIFL